LSKPLLVQTLLLLTAPSIIAIHGLDGHRRRSWTADNGVLWLRDLLPEVLPAARVITYGYNAYTRGRKGLSDQTLFSHGKDFVTAIAVERKAKNVREHSFVSYANLIAWRFGTDL
jgi:hypothetical protein